MFKITIDKEGRLLKPENVNKFDFAKQSSQDLCKHLGVEDVPFVGLMSFFADWADYSSSRKNHVVFFGMQKFGPFSLNLEGFQELIRALEDVCLSYRWMKKAGSLHQQE